MRSIFFNLAGISITISIVVVLILLLSSYLNERYSVKWRYFIWLILAVRLVIPLDFGLTAPPMELNFNDRALSFGQTNPYGQSLSGLNGAERQSASVPDPKAPNDAKAEGNYGSYAEAPEKPDSSGVKWSAGQSSDGNTLEYGGLTVSMLVSRIYWLGAAVFLLWQFVLYFLFRRATRRWYRNLNNTEIMNLFENLRTEMGIAKSFRIRVCRKIYSPMIVGLFKPTLLLPHEDFQTNDLKIILEHELIHFRRNDLWFKLLLIFANALHWFNPFIYLMAREANRDIEISCDEEVLRGRDLLVRKRYSEQILELMDGNTRQGAPVSTGFHGGKGMMQSRIRHIFDEGIKKRGILLFLTILLLIAAFSACHFAIAQSNWQVPVSVTADPYGLDEMGNRNSEIGDFSIGLPFDLNQDGKKDTTFSLTVSDAGKTATLKYSGQNSKEVQTGVLEGAGAGAIYGLQAANMEDMSSIMLLISVDYHGMPFGSGYWELYQWKNGKFEKVDVKSIEDNLQLRILNPVEIENNSLHGVKTHFIYDQSQYPKDYPAAGIYFKDDMRKAGEAVPNMVYYAPMTEYDKEGFKNWKQEAINKVMTGMEFVSGKDVPGWNHPTRALLKTTETVFITLPNDTATVTTYYQYVDGRLTSVRRVVE